MNQEERKVAALPSSCTARASAVSASRDVSHRDCRDLPVSWNSTELHKNINPKSAPSLEIASGARHIIQELTCL